MYTLTEKGRGWRTMRNDATRRVVDRKVVVLSPNTSRECSRMKITCPGTEDGGGKEIEKEVNAQPSEFT